MGNLPAILDIGHSKSRLLICTAHNSFDFNEFMTEMYPSLTMVVVANETFMKEFNQPLDLEVTCDPHLIKLYKIGLEEALKAYKARSVFLFGLNKEHRE